ncbi:MAG: patatin-like phospholipase family protein [Candidatus Omnitrophica bacterium]|jgi:NTE family protein|nr:patatin-like phospholipase family protein [Candidatus Omnitrophota bacterium]
MDIKEAKFILANTLPFNKLKEEEIDEFLSICELRKLSHGEILYKDQDPPDYFYFLLRGRIVILKQDDMQESEIELIKRGTSFGIISLFNEEPHSVTTKSIEESFVLKADKERFKDFLNKYPLISLEFYRILSQRIRARSGKKKIFQCKRIAVMGAHLSGKTSYMFNLGVKLKEQTRKNVICIEFSSSDSFGLDKLTIYSKILNLEDYKEETLKDYIIKSNLQNNNEIAIDCLLVKINDILEIPSLLNFLSENYHFIIYEMPDQFFDTNVQNCVSPVDYFHFLVLPNKEGALKAASVITALNEADPLSIDRVKVILSYFAAQDRLPAKDIKEILHANIYATLPSFGEEYVNAVRRISKEVGEVVIGLALGSGGAYGFAHIGVLRVLEENHIPIDIICGSSIGSVIASLWALGKTPDEIEKFMIEFAKKLNLFSVRGFSFPFKGLWRAKYLENILKKVFKDKTFYDLKHPLKVVVFDFLRKEAKILEDGPLYKAVAASCALPGVFEPINFKNRMLLDGGVLNPLPTKVLLNYGADKIIAVNVTPSQEEIIEEYDKKNKFHILDFIFGSIETMQRQFIEQAVTVADCVIHPNFGTLRWLEFEKVQDFIKKGELATVNKLDELKKMINV